MHWHALVIAAALTALSSMGDAAANKPPTVTVLTNSDFVNGTYRIRNTGRCDHVKGAWVGRRGGRVKGLGVSGTRGWRDKPNVIHFPAVEK